MVTGPSEVLHTIIIQDVRDEVARKRIARTLSGAIRNASEDQILSRMSRLPWTLTRRAPAKKAHQMLKLLERLGATVTVIPPLPDEVGLDAGETVLISESRVSLRSPDSSARGTQAPLHASHQRHREQALPPPRMPPSGTTRPPDEPEGRFFPLRPLSLGEILDRSFQIYRGQFWKLFSIAAIPYLFAAATILVVVVVLGLAGFTAKSLGRSSVGVLILLGILLIPSAIIFLSVMFYVGQGALIHAVSATYLGREVFIGESYRFVMPRLGRYVLTSLLFVCAAFVFLVASVALAIGSFFLFRVLTSSGWWSVLTWLPLSLIPTYGITKLLLFDKVVLIEDVAYMEALKRSWLLLTGKAGGEWPRGYLLRLIILLNLFVLIYFTIAMLFQLPASLIQLFFAEAGLFTSVLAQVLSNLGGVIAGVFSSVCMVVFYYDIRNRKEGFDLMMLASMTGERSRIAGQERSESE
jgi:hypothetical protein